MVAYTWEKTKKKERKESEERNDCWTAERTMQPGTPAVKTSNHMRKSKRFLRVPLLHLLNFYNLVDCQALGSTSTFHAIATPWSRKTEGRDRQKDREWDCWLNHPSHPQRSAFITSVCFQRGWWPPFHMCVWQMIAYHRGQTRLSRNHIRDPHTAWPPSLLCQWETCLQSCGYFLKVEEVGDESSHLNTEQRCYSSLL